MDEIKFISRLQRIFRSPPKGIVGIGDDAAVLPTLKNQKWVWTTDCHIENIHFKWNWLTPEMIGQRAAAASLSDIVAMGAFPKWALISFDLPRRITHRTTLEIAKGLEKRFRLSGAFVVGGNLSSSKTFAIHISILGETYGRQPWLRSAANLGDDVYVTGVPGSAALALSFLKGSRKSRITLPLVRTWQAPVSRLDLVQKLSGKISAAIDISDGLLKDAGLLAQESGVAIQIDLSRLPRPKGLPTWVPSSAWERAVLSPSDDYELLFTAPSRFRRALSQFSNVPVTRIGKILRGQGVRMIQRMENKVPILHHGWDHFLTD